MSEQKRAFLAIILSGLVIFIWQIYYAPKSQLPPEAGKVSNYVNNNEINNTEKTTGEHVLKQNLGEKGKNPLAEATETKTLSNENIDFKVTNNFHVTSFTNRLDKKNNSAEVFEGKNPFEIYIYDRGQVKPLNFKFDKVENNNLKGIDANYNITLVVNFDQNKRELVNFVLSSPIKYKYHYKINANKIEKSPQNISQFVFYGKDVERLSIGDDDSGETLIKWMAVDFNYHIFSMVFNNKELMKYNINQDGLAFFTNIKEANEVSGFFVYQKKDYDELIKTGHQLELSVDFGIFGIIAVPILKGLKFFYSLISNYGIAIILMTFVIRGITFPLQYKSYKSMKKMQEVQPELTKLKEKFKDDPQRMQKETMEAFKRAGANPMGGCLPLLLQFPVFIAFYKVLSASVELVDAPFYFWITDLSSKDPYFVFPVLTTLAIWGQQKFMPQTSADPTQRKIMMFMPFFFGFIMKDLPSGLVIYIFFSTLLGVAQQLWQYRTPSS